MSNREWNTGRSGTHSEGLSRTVFYQEFHMAVLNVDNRDR